MPRIPTAEQLGGAPSINVRGGISQLQLSTPRPSQEGAAKAMVGQSLNEFGNTLAQLALREKEKVNAARTEEATNSYLGGLMDLEYGNKDSGEAGYSTVLGGAAVKQPLLDNYQKKREDLQKTIRDKLPDENSQMAFDMRAAVADRSFDSRLYQHVAQQTVAYKNVVHKGVLETEQRMAALNWQQPSQIDLSIMRTRSEIMRMSREQGFDPANPQDRQVIDSSMIAAESKIHESVVNQMILQGQDTAANAYYAQVKSRLSVDDISRLADRTRAASTEGEAMRGVDLVWAAYGPKDLNDPVRLDVMEGELRKQYGNDPQIVKAAVGELRSRATAQRDAEQEVRANNQSKILSAYHDGSTLQDVQRMPEYWELDGSARNNLRDYITNRGYSEQQHARAEASYTDGAMAQAGFASYWELSNPKVLSALSEAQILSLEPELGQTLTGDLMKQRRALTDPSKINEASIDAELFNTIAADSGLKPYEPKQSADSKEKLGRLRNRIETMINTAQQEKGGKLTRDEKEVLMHKEMDKKVMVDEWGRDPKLPAAIITQDQRAKVYVPISDIDSEWSKGAINYMRSVGAVPLDWTDEIAKVKMKGRLERAYAHSIMGGTSDEGRNILEGR